MGGRRGCSQLRTFCQMTIERRAWTPRASNTIRKGRMGMNEGKVKKTTSIHAKPFPLTPKTFPKTDIYPYPSSLPPSPSTLPTEPHPHPPRTGKSKSISSHDLFGSALRTDPNSSPSEFPVPLPKLPLRIPIPHPRIPPPLLPRANPRGSKQSVVSVMCRMC